MSLSGMIEVLLETPITPFLSVRFRDVAGGHTRAYGGGKADYLKGSHYATEGTSRHPTNILTADVLK